MSDNKIVRSCSTCDISSFFPLSEISQDKCRGFGVINGACSNCNNYDKYVHDGLTDSERFKQEKTDNEQTMSVNKIQCAKCKKQFDPAYDFCENVEAVEAVMYFGDIGSLCGDCTGKLIEAMQEFVDAWERGV